MRPALLMLIMLHSACGAARAKRNAEEPLAFPQYADLPCPAGTLHAGTPPPSGDEIFCMNNTSGSVIRQGPAIRYFPGGEIAERGQYEANFQSGEWTSWYRDGTVKRRDSWVRGKPDGLRAEFHENGQRRAEGRMRQGERDGLWSFFDEEGARYLEGTYKNGAEDGTWREFAKDGTPVRERLYREGRMLRQVEL